MSKESPISGVVFGYLATAINYVFAVLYVIILTRVIPTTEYGYYNSLLAMMGVFSLFFPTLGVDIAIAREAAMLHARNEDITNHLSAILLISTVLTTAYSVTLLAAIPIYILSKIPREYLGIVYIYIAWIIAQSLSGVLSTYLWVMGRLKSQGIGNMIYGITFRVLEIALLIIMRNVYAIIISITIGQVAALFYYLALVGSLPNPLRGWGLLKHGFKDYLNIGFQNWLLGYVGSIGGYLLTYLMYSTIGPNYVALYGIITYMLGAVTALGGSVTNVFSSRLSHALGYGGDPRNLVRDYAVTSVVVTGVLAQLATLAAPLLPILGIVHGDYVKAIPYGMLLFGSSVLSIPVGIYTIYYWVLGRGWRSVELSAIGVALNLLSYVILVRYLGFYAVVYSSYISSIALVIMFMAIDPDLRNASVAFSLAIMGLLASSSSLLSLTGGWPITQFILLGATVLVMLIMRPIPQSVLSWLPRLLRFFIKPFAMVQDNGE